MITARYGLSPIQLGMLFHHAAAGGSGVDIEQLVIDYDEPIDTGLLERAWQIVVETHPVARTSFRWEGVPEPVQEVHSAAQISVEQREAWDEAAFATFLEADRARGFDFAQPPLMRLTLFRSGKGHSRLVWTLHHILMDGRAFVLVLSEVERHYAALVSGEPIKRAEGTPYKPYVEWVAKLDLTGADEFWRKKLHGLTAPTPLPPEFLPVNTAERGDIELQLPEEVTRKLRGVAEQFQVTLNTVVMGVWAMVLGRFSGEPEVVFGATKTTRRGSVENAESVVGLFLNTVPIRIALGSDTPVREMLRQLRAEWINLREFEHTPLVRIKKVSEFRGPVPLFDTLVVFENQRFDTALAAIDGKWLRRRFQWFEQTNFGLTLLAYADPAMTLKLEFDVRRFSRATAERILTHVVRAFESVAESPGQTIGNLQTIPEAEAMRLLVEWNRTQAEYPRETPLAELIEACVAKSPDAPAVIFGEYTLTYEDLNKRANRLARELRKHGVGPEKLVGIVVNRSADMVTAMLAAMKSGGAYVPLDPHFPKDRLAYMIEDSGLDVLITETELRESLPAGAATVLTLEDSAWHLNSGENLSVAVSAENLAYVIYTSGSTGKPKGVQVPRGALTNFLWSMKDWLKPQAGQAMLAVTTISFDIAGLEIWLPLLVGGHVVVASHETAGNGVELAEVMKRRDVRMAQATPVTWRLLLSTGWTGKRDLTVICGGEAMPPEVASQLAPVVGQLWNLYGPTETTIWSTGYRVEPRNGSLLIGKPLANTQCYVLDERQKPVPVGSTGELYIAGDGLARGYLNRLELTAEKFVANPFAPQPASRMYRTGDLARYWPDGNIECLGRTDNQVKIRGFRIELGEIESALAEHPMVLQGVARAFEDENGKRLVAYVRVRDSERPLTADLRTFLAERVPYYMVPSQFVFVDEFPLTANGKVDRKALPEPERVRAAEDEGYAAPRDEFESYLCDAWAAVLGLEKAGIYNDFFELGGDSLRAVQLWLRVQQILPGEQLPLSALLEAPTVERFAAWLRGRRSDGWDFLVKMRPGSSERPAFFCVHGAGGNVLSMRPLAMAMPADVPFYCLQAKGLDGSEPFYTVSETARCYIDEVRKAQAHGPYYLGGGCYGGLVAFEMARMLEQQGERIAILALMDSFNFAFGQFLPKHELVWRNALFYVRRFGTHASKMASLRPRLWGGYVAARLKTLRKYVVEVAKMAAGKGGNQFPVDPTEVQIVGAGDTQLGIVLRRVQQASLTAASKFLPKPYGGSAVVFRASQRRVEPYRDKCLGWGPVVKGGIETVEIQGDHDSIFTEPAVRRMAEELNARLRQSQESELALGGMT